MIKDLEVRWTLSILIKKRCREMMPMCTHREGNVRTEAETGVMWPRNSSSYQSWKRQRKDFPSRTSNGNATLLTS